MLSSALLLFLLWLAIKGQYSPIYSNSESATIKQEYLRNSEGSEIHQDADSQRKETDNAKSPRTSQAQIVADQAPSPSLKNTEQTYRKQAEKGNIYAQYKLGLMYLTGKDAIQDFVEAAKWLNIAADKGYAPAQYELGLIYRTGKGVPVNHELSYVWLNLAAAAGIESAAVIRDKVRLSLSSEQLSQAQKTSREWQASRIWPSYPASYNWAPELNNDGNESWVRS